MKDIADLEKALERGLSAWQKEIMDQEAKKIGEKAAAEVKKLTPVDTGKLRRSWRARIQRDGYGYTIWIYNNTVYGPAVNYGHRIVRGKKTVGKTKGVHMLETGIYNYKRVGMKNDIEGMLDRLRRAL